MKIRLHLKDPDGVSNSLDEAATEATESVRHEQLPFEYEEVQERMVEKLAGQIEKWVKYQEYVTIEIDTEAGTAIVVPV